MSENVNKQIEAWNLQWINVERLYTQFALKYGLSNFSLSVLRLIYESQLKLTQKEICSLLSLPKQTISSMINNLSHKGYVDKEICSLDHRNVYITLTMSGQQFCHELFSQLNEIEMKAFSQLTSKQREEFTKTNAMLSEFIKEGMEEFYGNKS